MAKVRFVKPHVVKRGAGDLTYNPGDIVEVGHPSYAEKYVRLGLAEHHAEPDASPAAAAPAAAATTAPATAADLLARADSDPALKTLVALRAAAVAILGPDAPAKRADLIKALEVRASTDAAAAAAKAADDAAAAPGKGTAEQTGGASAGTTVAAQPPSA